MSEVIIVCLVVIGFLIALFFIDKSRRDAVAKATDETIRRMTADARATRMLEVNNALNMEIGQHLDRLNDLVRERDELRAKLESNWKDTQDGGVSQR